MQSGVKGTVVGAGTKTKSAAFSLIDFIKKYVLGMGKQDCKSKERSVRIMMSLAAFLLIISFYPLLKKLKLKWLFTIMIIIHIIIEKLVINLQV